jgi:hypothetical protein
MRQAPSVSRGDTVAGPSALNEGAGEGECVPIQRNRLRAFFGACPLSPQEDSGKPSSPGFALRRMIRVACHQEPASWHALRPSLAVCQHLAACSYASPVIEQANDSSDVLAVRAGVIDRGLQLASIVVG